MNDATSIDEWRRKAFALTAADPSMGVALSKMLDFMSTVVKDGLGAQNVPFALDSLQRERNQVMEFDEKKTDPLRSVVYGVNECVGTMISKLMEQNSKMIERIEDLTNALNNSSIREQSSYGGYTQDAAVASTSAMNSGSFGKESSYGVASTSRASYFEGVYPKYEEDSMSTVKTEAEEFPETDALDDNSIVSLSSQQPQDSPQQHQQLQHQPKHGSSSPQPSQPSHQHQQQLQQAQHVTRLPLRKPSTSYQPQQTQYQQQPSSSYQGPPIDFDWLSKPSTSEDKLLGKRESISSTRYDAREYEVGQEVKKKKIRNRKSERDTLKKCHKCSKTFYSTGARANHMFSAHGDADKPRLACTHCGLAFARTDRLQEHLRNKHRIAPFQCATCSVGFNMRRELIEHWDESGHRPAVNHDQ